MAARSPSASTLARPALAATAVRVLVIDFESLGLPAACRPSFEVTAPSKTRRFSPVERARSVRTAAATLSAAHYRGR